MRWPMSGFTSSRFITGYEHIRANSCGTTLGEIPVLRSNQAWRPYTQVGHIVDGGMRCKHVVVIQSI